jgi:hypothetical protein
VLRGEDATAARYTRSRSTGELRREADFDDGILSGITLLSFLGPEPSLQNRARPIFQIWRAWDEGHKPWPWASLLPSLSCNNIRERGPSSLDPSLTSGDRLHESEEPTKIRAGHGLLTVANGRLCAGEKDIGSPARVGTGLDSVLLAALRPEQ